MRHVIWAAHLALALAGLIAVTAVPAVVVPVSFFVIVWDGLRANR